MEFRVLSESQIETLHAATLQVLEATGVQVLHEEGRKLLIDAGARPRENDVVSIPADLVERAIESAPSNVSVYRRDGGQGMELGEDRAYFGTGADPVNTLDPFTGERRRSMLQDVVHAARVADALPNIDFVMSMALASDTPIPVSDLYHFRAMIQNTAKPLVFTTHNRANMEIIRDIGWEVAGGEKAFREKPFFILYAELISPLKHAPDGVDKVLFCADHHIPVVYTSGLMSGATGPVTTTGSLVLANAEALSSLVLHQLRQPGAPIVSSNQSTIMDMRTSRFCHGAPELHLTHAALADMHHHYGLPIWGTAGASDSKVCDQQAAIEYTLSILLALQSGCNLVHDVGFLDCAMAGSLEGIVMCDEIIAMARRFMRGIEISDVDLALDVIDEVGPGGEFITHDHTREHFRTQHWHPGLMDRQGFEGWEAQGSKDMGTRLNERVREILDSHEPEPLDAKIRVRIDDIIDRYEAQTSS